MTSINPYAVALARLREFGWTQDTHSDSEGRMCVLGSMLSVYRDYPQEEYKPSWLADLLAEKILEQYPEEKPYDDNAERLIAHWNDDDYRIFPQVEAILQKAALEWETTHPTK